MKILLDECVDWRLKRGLDAYDVRTVKQLGWERFDDRALLMAASKEFEVLITVDKDLPHEQNLSTFSLAVVVLRGRSTRLADLRDLLADLHDVLPKTEPRRVYVVSWRDQ